MKTIRPTIIAFCAAGAIAASALSPAWGAGFVDPLDAPASLSPLASKSLLQAVARAGDRLVAVGQRGHIVASLDGGASWRQLPVPVSVDLTSVFFVDANHGWAVGHDGVILRTLDGGNQWEPQLDGRKANKLLVAAMERKLAAEPGSGEARRLLAEAARYQEQGPDKPFLDVWFADARTGYAVGAYNLIFRTQDGGNTWLPWFDRTENPKFFNLYSIRPGPGGLYIVGEGGLVLKLDPVALKFKALPVPYKGSFFGVINANSAVLVFGLRGNVFRSEDGGGTWAKVNVGLPVSIVGGTTNAQGAVTLVDLGGRAATSVDGGHTFARLPIKNPLPATGIIDAGGGKFVLVGLRGVAVADTAAR